MSSVGIVVGLQAVGDDVFVGHVRAELEVDGNGSILGAALLLTDDGERARIVAGWSKLYIMASGIEIGSLIDRDPKIRGGRPKIAGTGLTVSRIAGWYKLGMSPEEIEVARLDALAEREFGP